MFDISWTEFLLIGVVALIVIGPKELPGVLRTLGQYTRKVRGMATEFQNQFQEAMGKDIERSLEDAPAVRSEAPAVEVSVPQTPAIESSAPTTPVESTTLEP